MNTKSGDSHDIPHDSTGQDSGGTLRAVVRSLLALLPANAPAFIYTKILSPRPLRSLSNALLKRMIPPSLVLPEGTLFLNQADPVVSGALALGAYEPYFTDVLRQTLAPHMTMIDIGANLGYYTIIGSAHARAVIAFEPEEENARLLSRSCDANHRTNITLITKGLSDKPEQLPLEIHPDNKGKHSLLATNEKGTVHTTIELVTLDAMLDELGLHSVDLIKMDIEGWEAKALRGAMKTINQEHPMLMFEFAPARIRAAGDDPKAMLDSLIACGYTLLEINEEKRALLPIDQERIIRTYTGWDDYLNILARHSPS